MASKKDDPPRLLKRTVLVDPKADPKDGQYRQTVILEPVAALFDPEIDPKDERHHQDRQKRLWQRIEDAKQPPPRLPARELDANGLPILSIGVSATGIDNEFNFRLVERKRDFEDSVFHMLSELNYALRYNKTLSTDQRDHLKRTRDAFEESIGQLEKRVHASGPEDGLDLIEAAIAAAYEIGAFGGRHPIKGKLRIAPAAEKTKGRPPPKWNAVADGLLASTKGLPPSALGVAKKIRPELLNILTKEKLKGEPPSVSTLRRYISDKKKVGKKRT
jgi:hypothetical protein